MLKPHGKFKITEKAVKAERNKLIGNKWRGPRIA